MVAATYLHPAILIGPSEIKQFRPSAPLWYQTFALLLLLPALLFGFTCLNTFLDSSGKDTMERWFRVFRFHENEIISLDIL
jgi:hypothetical protein